LSRFGVKIISQLQCGRNMINEVLERAKKSKVIYEILGLSKDEYDTLFRQYLDEFNGIIRTGRFVEASIKLLKWLGFDDKEIDLEKLIKGVIVMKVVVRESKRKK